MMWLRSHYPLTYTGSSDTNYGFLVPRLSNVPNGCGSCLLNPLDRELCRWGHYSSKFCGLWIESESLWGQRSESLNPVALFRSAVAGLFPVNLFNYENRKVLQGVASELKWAATGCSRRRGLISDRWPFICMWSTFSVSPTYCLLHFVHSIT